MILGYPWPHDNRVAVMPGDHVLGFEENCQHRVEGGARAADREKAIPTWSIRKLQLDLPGWAGGGDIPSVSRMEEDELLEVMTRCGAPMVQEVSAARTRRGRDGRRRNGCSRRRSNGGWRSSGGRLWRSPTHRPH